MNIIFIVRAGYIQPGLLSICGGLMLKNSSGTASAPTRSAISARRSPPADRVTIGSVFRALTLM